MKKGTKTILFGVHQFALHPMFVAAAWTKLYGFPTDRRLWVAFVVHDLGYWGKANLDDEDGERHVEFGAELMERWYGKEWGDFCRYHSRFYARRDNVLPSQLCAADKYSMWMMPEWFYLIVGSLSGEIDEYMHVAREGARTGGKYSSIGDQPSKRSWFRKTAALMRDWAHDNVMRGDYTPVPQL